MVGTVDQLAQNAMLRLEEETPASPVFYSLSLEGYSAVIEGICEALLLIGRPVQIVNVVYTIQPNQIYQSMPMGMLAITDLISGGSPAWKWTLRDMDFLCSGNGPDWEQDTAPQSISRWFPVGFTKFGVWPAVQHAQQVIVTGIQTPVQSVWPFSGSQSIAMHDEFFQAIEKYAAHYLRLKESGVEFSASMSLYQGFMDDMKRMTAIEDRRDPYIFTRGVGAAADRGQAPDQR